MFFRDRRDDGSNPQEKRTVGRHFSWVLGGCVILAACYAGRHTWGSEPARASRQPSRGRAGQNRVQAAPAQAAGQQTTAAADPSKGRSAAVANSLVAVVNGEEIHRDALGQACLPRFGEEVLESLVNKHLIAVACRERNIVIRDEDVQGEVERMARRFRIPTDEWLKLLKKERGITPEKYARDIVWPTLALRRLAKERLTVSEVELKEAYESRYGPAVKARLIAVNDMHLAQRLHAQLKTKPDDFAKLAREHSQDVSSASIGGLIPPIHKHVGDKQIEQVAFNWKEGELSTIIRLGDQFAIFQCEGHLPARNVPMAEVRDSLADAILDHKLRAAADEVFRDLQARSVVKNVYTDPQASRQMPGVAATINGQPVTMQELVDECLARHGKEVLEVEINKLLLSQALRKKNLPVTQADLDAEIAHAAKWSGVTDPKGQPDIQRWFAMVTEEQGLSHNVYLRDIVWPSAALKALTASDVKVLDEDMRKGYEANYGPRVRCRAIVMGNLRRAQEVWDQARQNKTAEYFGQLAEQHSMDTVTRENRGEVPPIRRHGGQKVLEHEAFALRPGDLSGIIQMGDRYVILFCEGYTEPVQVNMDAVRELVYSDLYEKKLRIAMSETLESLTESAQIDNYLAGTSQSPKQGKPGSPDAPPSATAPARGAPVRPAQAVRPAGPMAPAKR